MSKNKKRKKNNNNNFIVVDSKRERVDYPRRDEEEFAAEVAPVEVNNRNTENDSESDDMSAGRVAGYIGLGIGIASLFMWSVILGPIAAVLGYYAYAQDSRTLGAWSMGLGIVATISYFILIPFVR